jgi:thiol-disulfide isomerase/thioredoxin
MKHIFLLLTIAMVTGCSSTQVDTVHTVLPVIPPSIERNNKPMVILPDLGLAPDLETTVWLNTTAPLNLGDLKGKVILLQMWTYGCINCRNVITSLKDWHAKYSDDGLVIIGNHFPEFESEKDLKNLTNAISRLGIQYPVTQDNEGANWRAYDNRFWPTLYLIDKTGHIRYKHIGEGNYANTEMAIQSLLAE